MRGSACSPAFHWWGTTVSEVPFFPLFGDRPCQIRGGVGEYRRDGVVGEHWPFAVQLDELAIDDVLESFFYVAFIKVTGTHDTGFVENFVFSLDVPRPFLPTKGVDWSPEQRYFFCSRFVAAFAQRHEAGPTFLRRHDQMHPTH